MQASPHPRPPGPEPAFPAGSQVMLVLWVGGPWEALLRVSRPPGLASQGNQRRRRPCSNTCHLLPRNQERMGFRVASHCADEETEDQKAQGHT